jgi:tetratricopeptide (TPR) repeat protein
MRDRLLLLAGALVAFGASLGSGFHFDDYAIFSDPALTSPGGWLRVWGPGQTRPLTYLTFWLNYQAGGTDPLGYHILNLALHLAAVLLAFECLRRLLPARAALLAAAIFAIHPIQAESVDYIWGRSMVLASLLCFGSLLAWMAGRPWLAVACFAAALAAKEECAAFPLVMALWCWTQRPRRSPWPIAAMLALSLGAGLRVIYAAAVTPGAQAGAQAGITPANYALAQGAVILRYLRLLAVPWGFTIDPGIAVPPLWLGALAWAAILTLAVIAWRSRAQWGLWLLAGLVLLLPSSSVFPAADLAADRRMYLPLVAFAAAAAVPLSRIRFTAVPVLVVAALLAASVFRTQVWASDEALWREALAQAPRKVRPRLQLARSVSPPEALQLLDEAQALSPRDPAIASEMGRVQMTAGNPAAALSEFGRALALDPRDAGNYNNRGTALAALGQFEAARRDFERALKLSPGLAIASQNLRKMQGR